MSYAYETAVEYKYIYCVDNDITGFKLYFTDEFDTRFAHDLNFCSVYVIRVSTDNCLYTEALNNSVKIKDYKDIS